MDDDAMEALVERVAAAGWDAAHATVEGSQWRCPTSAAGPSNAERNCARTFARAAIAVMQPEQDEALALREIHATSQGVIAAIPAALETARREGLEQAAIIAEADAESAFRASGFVGGRIDKIGPKIRALISTAPEGENG